MHKSQKNIEVFLLSFAHKKKKVATDERYRSLQMNRFLYFSPALAATSNILEKTNGAISSLKNIHITRERLPNSVGGRRRYRDCHIVYEHCCSAYMCPF